MVNFGVGPTISLWWQIAQKQPVDHQPLMSNIMSATTLVPNFGTLAIQTGKQQENNMSKPANYLITGSPPENMLFKLLDAHWKMSTVPNQWIYTKYQEPRIQKSW